jgi:CBS domain-containing protein
METQIVTVAPETPLAEIVDLFEKHRIKRVPVVEDGKLVGMVSRSDLLRALATGYDASAPSVAASDRQIRRQLLAEFDKQRWAPRNRRNIVVRDGVVHFWGLVDSVTQIDAMRVAAEAIPGVRQVRDHTIIGDDTAASLWPL